MKDITQDTLDLVKKSYDAPLTKSITTGLDLVNYDLEAPAKSLFPVFSPLRNMIARVSGRGGTGPNWKAITGINTANLAAGVSEGNRGGIVTTTTENYFAEYKGLGLEDYVTYEADYAAEYFQNLRATATQNLLWALMIQEEKSILDGNSSLALGITPTPTLATAAGGSLAAGTYFVRCVALTADGYRSASVAGGIPTSITRTNADGTTDTYGGGSAQRSAAASLAVSAGGVLSMSVTPVVGAFAYAWFWGIGAGNEELGAITTINSYVATADPAGTQNSSVASADNSTNDLIFDGIFTQLNKSGANGYYYAMPTGTAGTGTALSSNGAGGITEIDEAFLSFWNNYKLSPDIMIMSAQEIQTITDKVVAGGGAPLFRFNVDAQKGGVADVTLTAGSIVGSYLNKFTMGGGALVKVMLHPYMTPGNILFYSTKLPYPLSNVSNLLQVKTRQEYYQIDWPRRTRKYEYGVYVDEVLQCYFPPAFGQITNIAPG